MPSSSYNRNSIVETRDVCTLTESLRVPCPSIQSRVYVSFAVPFIFMVTMWVSDFARTTPSLLSPSTMNSQAPVSRWSISIFPSVKVSSTVLPLIVLWLPLILYDANARLSSVGRIVLEPSPLDTSTEREPYPTTLSWSSQETMENTSTRHIMIKAILFIITQPPSHCTFGISTKPRNSSPSSMPSLNLSKVTNMVWALPSSGTGTSTRV